MYNKLIVNQITCNYNTNTYNYESTWNNVLKKEGPHIFTENYLETAIKSHYLYKVYNDTEKISVLPSKCVIDHQKIQKLTRCSSFQMH